MIRRNIIKQVEAALQRQAAVALIGPRQVGKTTLALEIGQKSGAIYLDLENPDDRDKLANPNLFFTANEYHLVILDEIQQMPEIFANLRGIIDEGRRNNKAKNRFLILGSAAIELMRQSETLAGRIAYINMSPLLVTEIANERAERDKLWLRGGFPDSYLAQNDAESFALRQDFIRTYLERDIPMFGPRVPATTMQRLWTMLAHNQASLLNATQLARNLDVSTQSVTRYIDLLVDLLLVRRLPPLHANLGKRLVKSPKTYIRDSGLMHALLGITNFNQLSGHPAVGQSFEAFALETLLANLPWQAKASFYRTAAGAEIDLIIEFAEGKLWAIEIKHGLSARTSKGFHSALSDLQPEHAFIVHSGADRYPLAENIEAIGLYELTKELSTMHKL